MPVPSLRRSCAAALAAASIALPVSAGEPLTLAEAQSLAVGRSQRLAASTASISASRQMAAAAGQLPDPVLKLGVESLPINGPDRFSVTRDFMTMRRIGLSQEIPRAEKRLLRSERFEREAARTEAESRLQLANIRRETAVAWLDRYYAGRMHELVLRQIQETRLQVQAAETGFGAGRNSQADVFAARSALAMLEDRLSQVGRQERNAALMLGRWVGPAAERSAADPPGWQTSRLDDGTLGESIEHHPELAMSQAEVDAAQTEARLAQANRKADWTVEAMYSQRGPAYSNMVSVGVSVPLQWDRPNRQDREVAAKLARVEEARARYEEMLRSHDAEIRSLINDWKNGKERVARYRDQLVPLARQRAEAALTGYRTGKGELAAALASRRDELDTRIQALAVESETARAWARLNFLIPDHIAAPRQEKP
jgi:outer membrane protein TolC